eukprot:scaffold70726_cov34-Tisochrysis_lutea.AAC.2
MPPCPAPVETTGSPSSIAANSFASHILDASTPESLALPTFGLADLSLASKADCSGIQAVLEISCSLGGMPSHSSVVDDPWSDARSGPPTSSTAGSALEVVDWQDLDPCWQVLHPTLA